MKCRTRSRHLLSCTSHLPSLLCMRDAVVLTQAIWDLGQKNPLKSNPSVLQHSHYRHANLWLESSCRTRVICLGVLGTESLGTQLGLGAGTQPWQSRRSSRRQRQQNTEGRSADCSQSLLGDRGCLQRWKGATGHEEPFPDFLLRLPVRRLVGSNSNGPKPPIHITSSIIRPDDK